MVGIMGKLAKNAVFVALLALVVASCSKNPFSTRTSEDPQSTGGTYTDPVSAGIAVENLFNAYNEQNIGNVTRCLSDSFVFTFDFLNIDQPGEVSEWTEVEESRITDNIFHVMAEIFLTWLPSQTDLEGDTTAVYHRNYEITAITAESPAETTFYAGETILYLSETESARWVIDRWQDRHLAGRPYSWADLKSRYR